MDKLVHKEKKDNKETRGMKVSRDNRETKERLVKRCINISHCLKFSSDCIVGRQRICR